MTETRRRYTKRQKLTAIIAADMTSQEAASEALGIPRRTLGYWLDRPEFAEVRHKTREQLAEGWQMVAQLAVEKLALAIREDRLDPRDIITAAGVAVDKSQLLAGHATQRFESKDITDVFDDHETKAIVEGARQYLEGPGQGEGEEVAEDAAVEVPRP